MDAADPADAAGITLMGALARIDALRMGQPDQAAPLAAAAPVVDSAVPLTARELEVARLVADDLSTKEVAERLHLSARTVSNHLQNTYNKLGIARRTELAGALGRFGAPGGGDR